MRVLLATVFLHVFGVGICCETPTFAANTSVTVVGVRGVDVVSGCLEPDGALEKASYVQIVNQSVPVLNYRAIQNLPNLADVILDCNGIQDIVAGAFYNLPNLGLLRLKDNDIKVIRYGVFNNLSLSELNLMNNSVSAIESGAFDDLPNLSILNLDHNRIATWDSNWFLNSPQICTLSVKCNRLTELPARAFQHIRGVHVVNGRNVTTNIYLDENNIGVVHPRALEGVDVLGWLFLSKNQLEQLDEAVLDPLRQIDWLKLSFNRLPCVPDKIFEKIPTVANYMEGNPLTDDCKEKIAKY